MVRQERERERERGYREKARGIIRLIGKEKMRE